MPLAFLTKIHDRGAQYTRTHDIPARKVSVSSLGNSEINRLQNQLRSILCGAQKGVSRCNTPHIHQRFNGMFAVQHPDRRKLLLRFEMHRRLHQRELIKLVELELGSPIDVKKSKRRKLTRFIYGFYAVGVKVKTRHATTLVTRNY